MAKKNTSASPNELDFETYVQLEYLFAEQYAREGDAKPPSALRVSRIGNPDGVIVIVVPAIDPTLSSICIYGQVH